uniref:Sedoheptulokinase n=1 Tax=Sinocyclocheilus rhinocerous TaxID=307959 RepID=A0A673LQZ2_9TELE
ILSEPTTCLLDPVPTKLLKELLPVAEEPLLNIINSSLSLGDAKEQDPALIIAALDQCMDALPKDKLKKVKCIGVCGQMHGIVLWKSKSGCEWLSEDEIIRLIPKDVSQLITWQDGRCRADFLFSFPKPDWFTSDRERVTATEQSVKDAIFLCVEMNYCVSMNRLCDHMSSSLKDAGFPVQLLPVVVESGAVAGHTSSDVYSCMTDKGDAVLNMSTSAQLTFGMPAEFSPPNSPDPLSPVAYFPYFHGSYLAVAASLNGGNVMAIFVRMLDLWMKEFGLEVNESTIYSQLIQSALAQPNTDLTVTTVLLGERHDPTSSASVSQISPSNLSLGHVTRAVCRGIIENMATMMPPQSLQAAGVRCIIGSGSALSFYGKDVDSAVGVAMVFNDQT